MIFADRMQTMEERAAVRDGRVKRRSGFGGWPAALVGVWLLLFAAGPVMAQPAERQIYDLGTATTDGVSHPLGVTIAALIKLKLLPQANIDIDAKNTEGSRNNALRLRNYDLDLGILTNLDAYHAFHGTGPFAEEGADPSLRLLTNLWTSTYHFVVRTDDAPTGTFADFLNLQGKRIALGKDGSTLREHAGALFASLDIDIEETYQLEDMGGMSAAQAFLDGKLDGFLLTDEERGADIVDFLEEAGDQATVLAIGDDDLDTIRKREGAAWIRIVLPAGTMPGQTEDHATIGMRNLLAASERVDEDAVYRITKTIFDNLPFLQEMHSATVGISLETALDQLLIPVHAGAANYYREVGVTVPEPEPVRRSTLSQTTFLSRFDTIEEARTSLNGNTISILGGQAGQTITRMTSELATSLDDDGIRVIGMTNPRPAENIADVLYARGVDSAVVPLDILDYALEQDVYPGIRSKIVYAAELFTEEVHLVASGDIDDIDDLIDRKVNLGPRGSATEFTASFLLDALNIPVEPSYHDQPTALTMLADGELAAAFLISGKPMPLLSDVPDDAGLRLLSVPPLEGDAYRPATLTAVDYPALVPADGEITTFGVRNVLLSYNWRSDNPRYQVLSTFIGAFFDRLPALQRPDAGFHPKWQDIDPLREIEGWRRSQAAQRWIDNQNAGTGVQGSSDG